MTVYIIEENKNVFHEHCTSNWYVLKKKTVI